MALTPCALSSSFSFKIRTALKVCRRAANISVNYFQKRKLEKQHPALSHPFILQKVRKVTTFKVRAFFERIFNRIRIDWIDCRIQIEKIILVGSLRTTTQTITQSLIV